MPIRADQPLQARDLSPEIAGKFRVENNTLVRDVKNNLEDHIKEWIGDDKQPDFKPQYKNRRWDEVDFSIRAQEHIDAVVETTGEIIKYITPDFEFHMQDNSQAGDDGGFDLKWVLPQKPKTNILTATIQIEGLNLYYQQPLTQEQIDQGAFLPDNVIGSYVAYHASKGQLNRANGKKYKTGKAFNLYRTKATDAEGNWVWCNYNDDAQDTGELVVTIPQDFLDSAFYPMEVK